MLAVCLLQYVQQHEGVVAEWKKSPLNRSRVLVLLVQALYNALHGQSLGMVPQCSKTIVMANLAREHFCCCLAIGKGRSHPICIRYRKNTAYEDFKILVGVDLREGRKPSLHYRPTHNSTVQYGSCSAMVPCGKFTLRRQDTMWHLSGGYHGANYGHFSIPSISPPIFAQNESRDCSSVSPASG